MQCGLRSRDQHFLCPCLLLAGWLSWTIFRTPSSSDHLPLAAMTLVQLGLCASSIYTTFLIWGLLQERLTKTPYISPATLLHPNPQPEYFRSPLFLNTVQAIFSSIVACVYLLLRNRGSKKPVSQILGLHTLTPNGIPDPPSSSKLTEKQNGSNELAASGTSSRWISPLLARYVAIAALQSTASQLVFLSLRYISYPTLTLAKSCKLVPVLIMNVVLYRRKFAAYKYAVVGLVTLGIWLFMAFAPAKTGKKVKGPESSSLIGLLPVPAQPRARRSNEQYSRRSLLQIWTSNRLSRPNDARHERHLSHSHVDHPHAPHLALLFFFFLFRTESALRSASIRKETPGSSKRHRSLRSSRSHRSGFDL